MFDLVTASIYGFIGYRLSGRRAPFGSKLPAFGFVAFWFGLAISTLVGPTGGQAFLAAFGRLSLPIVLVVTQVSLLSLSLALWGLLYYLVFLYTGRRQVWVPIGVFYVIFYLFLQYFIFDANPIGIQVQRWTVMVQYAKPFDQAHPYSDPYVLALIVGLLVPQMLAAIAYLTLAFRAEEPTARYRISLVSISILVWFGAPFFSIGTSMAQQDNYQIVSRFIGLGAAIAIFLAYYPPGWIRRRYGIKALGREAENEDPSPGSEAANRGPDSRSESARRVATHIL